MATEHQGPAVAELMAWPAITVEPDVGVAESLQLMRLCGIRHLVLTERGIELGVLCRNRLLHERSRRCAGAFSDLVPLVGPDDDARAVTEAMLEDDCCAAVVLVPGGEYGIVTRGDVARSASAVAALLPRCVSCRGHHRVLGHGGIGGGYCEECLTRTLSRRGRTAASVRPTTQARWKGGR